ncbi:flavin reductase family protein [Pelagibius sp. Alg239-R121]|uniref:flavin reductase family protein n=1 Tax=Pelagibius sp. Alg239-R121 TaxID=2993448 RepID=UPI0024A62D68|nr:flavin reductase family protein [Pelagibius sp. Alg239-R121]
MTRLISSDLDPRQRYNLLTNIVIPRPIALVTTVDKAGGRNAAPFSFFNAVCGNPPTVILGINRDDPAREKDTVANIQDTGEFVVNLVAQEMLEKMTVCEVDVPAHVDELNLADIEVEPSATVSVPRLVQTPASLECRLR